MHPFLNIAIQASRAASRVIVDFFDRLEQVQVTEKNRNDLVTQVDKYSEEEIISHIKKAYPRHNILAEESGKSDGDADYTWVIDPLDGTANFVHGIPHFSISIAVMKGNQVEVACIYDPIRQELFTAERGKGAQLNSRRLRVSSTKLLENSMIGTGFPFRAPELRDRYMKNFTDVMSAASGVRRAGSAALDLAYVAAGRFDAFWELSLAPWDIAAGVLLIQEAGGIVTDIDGSKNYFESGNIVCGNIHTHKLLSDIV